MHPHTSGSLLFFSFSSILLAWKALESRLDRSGGLLIYQANKETSTFFFVADAVGFEYSCHSLAKLGGKERGFANV
ncbi:hypothetical protein J3E74DRAFT_308985, partial [Bipolaris maydis]